MIQIKTGQHLCIVGMPGSGKSFSERNLWLPPHQRIVLIDTEMDDFADFPKVKPAKAIELCKGKKKFVVRIVATGNPEVDTPMLDRFCMDVVNGGGHDFCLAIDEVTDFSTASYITPGCSVLMRKARHHHINVIAGTQRPQFLNKAYFSLSVHHVFFALADYDVAAVKSYAPWLSEYANLIPYGSFKSLYQGPTGELVLLAPCKPYNWKPRLAPEGHKSNELL